MRYLSLSACRGKEKRNAWYLMGLATGVSADVISGQRLTLYSPFRAKKCDSATYDKGAGDVKWEVYQGRVPALQNYRRVLYRGIYNYFHVIRESRRQGDTVCYHKGLT
jgi:hypothetical protein